MKKSEDGGYTSRQNIEQAMISLQQIREDISLQCSDILLEIDPELSGCENDLSDEEILETLNSFFESEQSKFESVEEAIEYFETLDI